MTDLQSFAEFPDGARVWIYGFASPLSAADKRVVRDRLSAFLEQWHSHRVDVRGAFAILHDRFVVLAGASADGISGCSIDSSVENFKYLRETHGLDGLNRGLVFYRDTSGSIQALERPAFRAAGVEPETPVFDTTLQTLGDLRAGLFERPLRDSWHARLISSR